MYQRQQIGRILADMGVIAPAQIDLILKNRKRAASALAWLASRPEC